MEKEQVVFIERIEDCPDIFELPTLTEKKVYQNYSFDYNEAEIQETLSYDPGITNPCKIVDENYTNKICGKHVKDETDTNFEIEHIVIKEENVTLSTKEPCDKIKIEFNNIDEDLNATTNSIVVKTECDVRDYDEYNKIENQIQIKTEELDDSNAENPINVLKVVDNSVQINCEGSDSRFQETGKEDKRHSHKSKMKSRENQYICSKCNYQTNRKDNFLLHYVTHDLSMAKWLKCNVCEFKTIYKSSLNGHLRTHMDRTKISCQYCGKNTFTKRLQLDCHLLAKHKDQIDINDIKRNIYKCSKCSFASVNRSNLKIHMLKHKDLKSDLEKFNCSICEFTTFYKARFHDHVLKHENKKPFTCSRCDKSYVRKEYFDSHIVNHHYNCKDLVAKVTHKIHGCEHCNFKTLTHSKLKNHITNCPQE